MPFNFPPDLRFPLEIPEHILMKLHSAWYSGDPRNLGITYRSMIDQVGGAARESFWTKVTDDGLVKMHIPIASDIAQASADMLFAEPPEITIPEAEEEARLAREATKQAQKEHEAATTPPPVPPTPPALDDNGDPLPPEEQPPAPPAPTPPPMSEEPPPAPIAPSGEGTRAQERLDQIIGESAFANRLIEAAESCAAMGGVYLVPTWDLAIADHPILAINQADNAIPEFKWGYLTAVTFFKTVWEYTVTIDGVERQIVYRLMERHEAGNIMNALFKGDPKELGVEVPLTDRPETEGLLPSIPTGWERLMVVYVPNMRPNRRFRGSSYGQSDLAGVEQLMDALDEVYSSWMRDIRLARARMVVPESYLDFEDDSEGKKQPYFDVDKATYVKMAMDPLTAKESGLTLHQFDIRMAEHVGTAYELLERIVTHAGYSPQTFGLKMDGKAESGTALNQRERKTYITRGKKWAYWKHAIEDVLEMMLHIDSFILKNPTPVLRPSCELAETMNTDLSTVSTALSALNNAQAVSIETKVRMLNPDWTDERVDAEVAAIKEEQGIGQGASATIPNPLSPMGLEDDIPPEEDPSIIGEA